jgi:D-alanyl-D-alanine carboxypeptidase (penicillin-binding protein 5/6)
VRLRSWLPVLPAALALAAPSAAAAPQVAARAWLVQNAATGEVLLRHDDRARLPVASLTKLMTVLVTLRRAELDDVVTVSARAAMVGESSMHLRPGERVSVRDLVEGALVQSANDAAWALAFHVGRGSADRFVGLMNAEAQRLGLGDTHFVRPDGLDAPGHVSSARDVTKLARVAMNDPFVRETVRQRRADAAGRSLHTWNDLLGSFPGLIGVKTGHTRGAGWSQVAAARGRGLTIYATILGSPTRGQRNSDLRELLAWGLSRYRVVSLVRTGRVYASAETPYGRAPVRLVAERPLVRVVRVGRPLRERVLAAAAVELPVAKGARLGEVEVWDGETLVGRRALVAAAAVEKPDFAGRARWYVERTLHNAWGLVS